MYRIYNSTKCWQTESFTTNVGYELENIEMHLV